MRPFAATLLGVAAGYLAAIGFGNALRAIVALILQQPDWDELSGASQIFQTPDWVGFSAHVLLAGPANHDQPISAVLVSEAAIMLMEAAAVGFFGGLVSALINRSHHVPMAALTCVPFVVVLIAFGEYARAGEAVAYLAAIVCPIAAVLGPVAVQKWRRGAAT